MWFHVLDRMIEIYTEYIVNNKSVQKALKASKSNEKVKAYKRFAEKFSEYISELFDDMSRNVVVESIITVHYPLFSL